MREIEENKLKHTLRITITFEGLLVTNMKKRTLTHCVIFYQVLWGQKDFDFLEIAS